MSPLYTSCLVLTQEYRSQMHTFLSHLRKTTRTHTNATTKKSENFNLASSKSVDPLKTMINCKKKGMQQWQSLALITSQLWKVSAKAAGLV